MKRSVVLFIILLFGGENLTVAAEKTFKITTEPFAPYIGEQLRNGGWTMDVARAALEPQGYKVILKLRPWARAMEESKEGVHDGLYLAYYTEEREQWYAFSISIGNVRTGFYKMKGKGISYKTLQNLKGYEIGLTRGAAISPAFDKADFLKKQFTVNDILSLRKLLVGRIDLFAGSELVARYLINTEISSEDRNKFEFMEPPLAVHKLHMAVSRNAPNYMQKLEDFNQGIKQIFSDGTYEKILKNHGFK